MDWFKGLFGIPKKINFENQLLITCNGNFCSLDCVY